MAVNVTNNGCRCSSSLWPAGLRQMNCGSSRREWTANAATTDEVITREADHQALADITANKGYSPVVFLKDMTFEELEAWVVERFGASERKRAKLLWQWMYREDHWAASADEMTGVSREFCRKLAESGAFFDSLRLLSVRTAADGTRKVLFELVRDTAQGSAVNSNNGGSISDLSGTRRGGVVETVLIPHRRASGVKPGRQRENGSSSSISNSSISNSGRSSSSGSSSSSNFSDNPGSRGSATNSSSSSDSNRGNSSLVESAGMQGRLDSSSGGSQCGDGPAREADSSSGNIAEDELPGRWSEGQGMSSGREGLQDGREGMSAIEGSSGNDVNGDELSVVEGSDEEAEDGEVGEWEEDGGAARQRGGRNTVCISTQLGCAMGCTFCYTAKMGLQRNLTVSEMVDQVVMVKRLFSEEVGPISNVVFMGMGEPLHNLPSVLSACSILLHPLGLHLSPSRTTVSTCGLVPQVQQFCATTPASLAVSLHATTDAVRDLIMPVNRRYNLSALLHCLQHEFPVQDTAAGTSAHEGKGAGTLQPIDTGSGRATVSSQPCGSNNSNNTLAAASSVLHSAAAGTYEHMPSGSASADNQPRGIEGRGVSEEEERASSVRRSRKGRHVFIEYVMLDGINDSDDDAYRLASLTSPIACKINLIVFNPHPGSEFQPSPLPRVRAFQHILVTAGCRAYLRNSRGDDEMAACGQLGQVAAK